MLAEMVLLAEEATDMENVENVDAKRNISVTTHAFLFGGVPVANGTVAAVIT